MATARDIVRRDEAAEPVAAAAGPEAARAVPPRQAADTPHTWRRAIFAAKLRGWIPALLGLGILAVSLWILHDVLREFRYADLVRAYRDIGWGSTAAAIGLTAMSFLALTGYEHFALGFAGKRLAFRWTALGAFVAQSISHTTGFAAVVAMSLRYRIYVERGLDIVDVAKVQAFFVFTFGLGMAMLTGGVLLLEPDFATRLLPVPGLLVRAAGLAALIVVLTYIVWSWRAHRPIRIMGYTILPPRPRITFVQILLAFIDLGCAAAALWVLLPADIEVSYFALLGMYLAAIVLGIVSHVPGALGVFEGVMLLQLQAPPEQTVAVVGALLVYRVVYYLLPFMLGSLLLGSLELGRLRGLVDIRAARLASRLSPLMPMAAAGIAVLAGAVLLFSGVTPPVDARLASLHDIVPLAVIEVAHVAGGVMGAALLLLARPLRRRLIGAWTLATLLLAGGILASLLKGLDFEEALVLGACLAVLLSSQRGFYRRSRLLDERLTSGWWVAVLTVLGASVWLLFFAYKNVDYNHALWWRIGIAAEASRAMRAAAAAGLLALAAGLFHLVRPAPRRTSQVPAIDLALVRSIVAACPTARAHLALTGDKAFLFDPQRSAFVMYGISGHSWIAMGEPVGPDAAWTELIWSFHEIADRSGGRTVFYEVSAEALPYFVDLGLRAVKLGERARVPLDGFELKGRRRQDLRSAVNRAQRMGQSFEVLGPAEVAARMGELEAVSLAWLANHKTREKRFSLGAFDPAYLATCPVAVVRCEGRIQAFANLWRGGGQEECSVDLMRYASDAGPGVIDYLMTECLLWAKAEGFRWFDLGMAPLAGLPEHRLAPLWSQLGRLMVRHGAQFYNFKGLRAFKSKFDPVWEPSYLVYPDGRLALVAADLAALIAGGWQGIVRR